MRIMILGGTGFVGPHVVTRLCELGHHVTVAHRGHTEAVLPPAVQHVHHPSLGERGPRFLAGAADDLRRQEPEIVVHMISANDQDARAVMGTFRGTTRLVVAISSIDVYRAYGRLHRTEPGPPEPVPLAEDAALRERLFPDRPGVEKILTEQAVLDDPALPGTVLRWPMVYGPGDRQHRLFPYLRRMDAGRPAILLEETGARWRGSRGYSENVAHAVVLAVTDDRAADRVYNVGEAHALAEADWVRTVGGAAGWGGVVVTVPRERAPAHLVSKQDPTQHWVVDTGRIRHELGYGEPVSRDEALRRTIAWERAHPPTGGRAQEPDYAAEDAVLAELSRPAC